MTTKNTSAFALHYMWAAELLMDAIGEPRAETFDKAHQHAIHALNAAFTVPGAPGGGIEWGLGHDLARSIENAARAHGYVGLPATRQRPQQRPKHQMCECPGYNHTGKRCEDQ